METLLHNRRAFRRAWMIGDWERVRELVVRGAVFATMTIRTKTVLAERRFALWLEGESVDNIKGLMGTQRSTIQALLSLTVEQVQTIVNAEHKESTLGAMVKGLGCAKTSFSLACAGIGMQGCIDVHHERQYVDKVGDKKLWSKAIRRGDHAAYRQLLTLIWGEGDTAVRQWVDWLANLPVVGAYTTSHAILTSI